MKNEPKFNYIYYYLEPLKLYLIVTQILFIKTFNYQKYNVTMHYLRVLLLLLKRHHVLLTDLIIVHKEIWLEICFGD